MSEVLRRLAGPTGQLLERHIGRTHGLLANTDDSRAASRSTASRRNEHLADEPPWAGRTRGEAPGSWPPRQPDDLWSDGDLDHVHAEGEVARPLDDEPGGLDRGHGLPAGVAAPAHPGPH